MREPGAVMVAGRRDEHLRLVLQAPKRLAVDDSVAIALERSSQAAGRLLQGPDHRIGAGSDWRQLTLLTRTNPFGEGSRDLARGMLVAGSQELLAHTGDSDSAT